MSEVKLNYKRFGSGEPLFILHGLMGMLDNWQGLAKQYAEFFDVIIVDQRNHGHSPHVDKPDTYDAMMKDLVALMAELNIEKANFIGHSMGGKTVMKLAENFPAKVDKLVVADIAPRPYPVHHDLILKGLRSVPLEEIKNRTQANEYLEKYIDEAGVRQFLLKSLYWNSQKQLDWRFNLDVIERDIANFGEEVADGEFDGETLFVRGSNSKYIQEEDEEQIFDLFPNAEIMTIENAGHWLHAEQPAQFFDITTRFLLS